MQILASAIVKGACLFLGHSKSAKMDLRGQVPAHVKAPYDGLVVHTGPCAGPSLSSCLSTRAGMTEQGINLRGNGYAGLIATHLYLLRSLPCKTTVACTLSAQLL